jgi:hypothetical protein
MSIQIISGAAAINKAIDSISNRGKRLDHDIQVAGLSCLAHIEQHGDVTLFNRLFHALPKGARRNALAAWGCAFGKLQLNHDKATKGEKPFLFNRDANTDMAGAEEQQWYTFKPEKAPSEEFDFGSALALLCQKAARAQQSGKTIKGIELLEQLPESVRAVVAA